jgi:phosphatidylinositol alpha-1,6-mannosyltransferase
VFALPNRTVDGDLEGFGMVLLEAQACARPVLAGDSGGTAEALCDGESGVIVDCTSPRTLAAAVGALLEDCARRERMGAAGRRRMVEHFDFDRRAALAVEVLARVRQR